MAGYYTSQKISKGYITKAKCVSTLQARLVINIFAYKSSYLVYILCLIYTKHSALSGKMGDGGVGGRQMELYPGEEAAPGEAVQRRRHFTRGNKTYNHSKERHFSKR